MQNKSGRNWPVIFYAVMIGLVATCFVAGAVGVMLEWEPAMLLLYIAGGLFGVLAVTAMLSYYIGRGFPGGRDRKKR